MSTPAKPATVQWPAFLTTTSPVTLGLGRILLGLLLIADAVRRWGDLDVWYTNAGLMPNHTMLWAPQARFHLSAFFSLSDLHEARFVLLLTLLVYAALMLGWRTRLMTFLAMLAHVSLDCRIHYLLNGGDFALACLLIWANFLPLGAWLSVDALIAKVKASRLVVGKDGVASLKLDPAAPAGLFEPPKELRVLAFACLVLQVAVIYFFNYVHKDGSGWFEGRVLYDVLHQDRIATWLAVQVRPLLTPEISLFGTRATQVIEAALPALLLAPVASAHARRLAIFLGLSLHLGFWVLMNLGVFSATMCLFWFFLLRHDDVLFLLRKALRPKEASAGTLYFDADCGICSLTARMLLCMQATSPFGGKFSIKANSVAVDEAKVPAERLDKEILWVDAAGAQRWGAKAMAAMLRTFPFCGPIAFVVELIGDGPYKKIAANRMHVSSFLGLGACGIARTPEPFDPIPPWRTWRSKQGERVTRALLAFTFVVFVCQVLAQNRAVPPAIKIVNRPFWVEWPVEYFHFGQGWRMFDESPRTDFTVVVRARTVDGRLVDPLSERASPDSPPGAGSIPGRLDHNQYFCDYLSKIADDARYHHPLRDWVLQYPQRTGNVNDAITSFQVVLVSDVSPAMGAPPQPTNTTERVFFQFP